MFNWLFPHKCIVCLDILTVPSADGLCGDCKGAFTEVGEQCAVCGRALPLGQSCQCEGYHFAFVKNRSVFVYDNVMGEVIHAFKYGNHPAHGRVLGKVMAERFDAYFEEIDLIMPIPMYRPKERRRGFNQADILAREIALHTGITYDNKSLRRVRDTVAQSGLSVTEREANLAGAFKLASRNLSIVGKNVLLVDDIMTTGSTLDKCAAELLREGAAAVCGFTLSATIKRRNIATYS